jgi:membrane protease YdiL (CAAX protease family)
VTPKQTIAKPSQPHSSAWAPWQALGVVVFAYICSQLILVLPIVLIAIISGSTESIKEAWAQLALMSISSTTIIFIIWAYLRYKKQNAVSVLGFKKLSLKQLGWTAIVYLLYLLSIVVVFSFAKLIPAFDIDQTQDVGFSDVAGFKLVFAFLGLVVLAPIAEEILFRGFLYKQLILRWSKLLSAIIVSLLFGLVHFQWNVAVDTFILSLFAIWLLERTGNLWTCVLLHATKNFVAFIALFLIR